ncbi:MAG: hypothetical protein R3F24_03745 [Gammaproteobacteria bacterium]
MRMAGITTAGLLCGLALTGSAIAAAPPNEPIETKIEAVNVAGREFDAAGHSWALSSTVVFQVPGKKRASLSDVDVGDRVLIELVNPDAEVPVVRVLTVLPD